MINPMTILAMMFAVLSLFSFISGIVALKRRNYFGGSMGLLIGLLFLSLAATFGLITVGIQGYRAMVHEETAAVVKIEPTGPQKFKAKFRFPDGREVDFHLAGDEIYVDAHILKWKPIANFFGLHTTYELDRVSGRYLRLEDEQSKPRTVFSLSQKKPLDLFDLRRKYSFLTPLLDAEYGSATFGAADKPAEVEVQVSTTGLLLRKAGGPTQ